MKDRKDLRQVVKREREGKGEGWRDGSGNRNVQPNGGFLDILVINDTCPVYVFHLKVKTVTKICYMSFKEVLLETIFLLLSFCSRFFISSYGNITIR